MNYDAVMWIVIKIIIEISFYTQSFCITTLYSQAMIFELSKGLDTIHISLKYINLFPEYETDTDASRYVILSQTWYLPLKYTAPSLFHGPIQHDFAYNMVKSWIPNN